MKQGTRTRTLLLSALLATGLGTATTGYADDQPKPVFGWVESAVLEPWGVEVKAKLDTGALTSSLHAENIEQFEKDGDKWVRFTIDVEDEATGEEVEKEFEKPLYREVVLRGAGGTDHRPVVVMRICMGDTLYEEQFSLRDRSKMIYPMLIGRRAIQDMGVVDVTRTFLQDPNCDEDSPVKRFDPEDSDEDIGI